ncbi:MAG: TldD/PmbA family protein [Cyanobacteria bacterium J06648_11]
MTALASNPDRHLDRLEDLISRYRDRADFLAIRLEESEGTDIFIRNDEIETLSETLSSGGHVRVCHDGGWGFASFNRLEDLETRIEEAIAAARRVGRDRTYLATVEPQRAIVPLELSGTDPRQIPLARKKALCESYIEALRSAGDEIASSGVRYGDVVQQVWLATSDGTAIAQAWADMELRAFATARRGDRVQTGRETCGSRRGFEDLEGLEDSISGAGKRAIAALSMPVVQGGSYTVVIDPILTGLFVHEAFGHLSEADMAYENPDLLESMSMGRRFGSEDLQIWDGAAPAGHRGSYAFDDEGTPATATQLIKDGRLVGRLHSRETAGVLDEQPTGNARCLNYHYAPIVRMTNTWIDRGTTPVADLIRGIDDGIYASNWVGGMTNGEMFTFTAGEARLIQNGELADPVRDVTLSGNVFQTLANIEAIGDDFAWDESGGCGKGGQSGLPVGCGGPSLRIRDVAIGGETEE